MEPQPQQPQIDFDALIRPALEGLEGLIAPLTSSTENRVREFQQGGEAALAGSQANIGSQVTGLERSGTQAKQEGESAADEARRQFSEISQGLQARYGGSTGTGRFANEQLGAQTMRNIANFRQQVNDRLAKIDDTIQQVREVGRLAQEDYRRETATNIQKSRDNLDLQIADIRRQQGVLQSQKAQMTAQAIQGYQTEVNAINARNTQFLQQVAMQQMQAEQALKAAAQKTTSVAKSLPQFTLSEGQTRYQLNPETQQYDAIAGGSQAIAGTGLTGDDELDKLLGLSSQSRSSELTPGLNSLGAGYGL